MKNESLLFTFTLLLRYSCVIYICALFMCYIYIYIYIYIYMTLKCPLASPWIVSCPTPYP